MTIEKTLAIIKPDAVKRNLVGSIIKIIESNHLVIKDIKMLKLTSAEAKKFYYIHEDKDFYPALIKYMTSYSVIVMILEGDNAVKSYRKIMGSTNPHEAADKTIRKLYAENTTYNSVHGSDSTENAFSEINFFFSNLVRK